MVAATTIAAVAMALKDERSIDLEYFGTIPKSPEEQKCENLIGNDNVLENIDKFRLAMRCLERYLFENKIEPNEGDYTVGLLDIERHIFLNGDND